MGKALYRKHRPKKLSEIVGQTHITQTLSNALSSGQVGHAYLLTGPRGTGKTSIARILAHEVNGLPYEDDSIHLDIIEIDAASNRRIDEIRELRDKIHIAPTSAKYKVYIIDEVHMLTREAFNALLKTLEEPPEHAIFILATTEAHKLPDTIISRTQRFSLKPVAIDLVTQHLQSIARSEGIKIDDDALELVAQHGQGSFRDSISFLDQVRMLSDDMISRDTVETALGRASEQLISDLVQAVNARDATLVQKSLAEAREAAAQPAEVASQLADALRTMLFDHNSADPQMIKDIIRQLMDVASAPNPQLALELALFNPDVVTVQSPPPAQHKAQAPTKQATPPKAPEPQPEPVVETATKPVEKTQEDETPVKTDISSATDAPTPGDWQDILSQLKGNHNTLYGIVRMATPSFEPGVVTLGFKFAFHKNRISDARYTDILAKTAQSVLGHPIKVLVVMDKSSGSDKPQEATPDKPSLNSITDIFGDDIAVSDA
jgi:DNA polymerase-3 subunit gamma/tau